MTSNLFHKVDGGVCVLRRKGVYRQCEVYQRAGVLFSKWGIGFVMLYSNGTSVPDIHLDFLDVPMEVSHDVFGKKIVAV